MSAPVLNPSRRAFLRRLVPTAPPEVPVQTSFARSGVPLGPPAAGSSVSSAPSAPPPLAVIAGRFCLAYRHSFCSVCRERCPVPGAVVVERGLPRIDPALCNGCRICHDVCPAPVNAIRLVPRPAGVPVNPVIAIPDPVLP